MGKIKEWDLDDENDAWYKIYVDGTDPVTTVYKCTCGASITMGKDDHPQWHSDYCPLSEDSKYILSKGPIKDRRNE